MFHYFNAVQNKTGDALTGYFVKAVDTTSGNVVDIYADANATPIVTVSGIANAAQVDSNGNVSFYINSGTYHVDHYAADGVTFLLRIENVPMVDVANLENVLGGDRGLAAAGSTNDFQADVDFSGAADGTTQFYRWTDRVHAQGANNIDYVRNRYLGTHVDTTGGVTNIASGQHSYVWLNTTGTVTFANIIEGHLRIDAGSITNQANYYNCASVSFITGSVNIVVGYNANQIGDATSVTTAYSFNAEDNAAATLAVGFRSNLTADSKKYAFLDNGGAQSAFSGKVKFGLVGAAAEAIDVHGNILSDGNIRTSAGRVGYASGAGGTVTQVTSRTTAVTINKPCGEIDLVSAAGSTSWQTFTVNNTIVGANDTIRVCQKSGTDKYQIHVTRVAAGAFDITFATTGGTTTEAPTFNFSVMSGQNS